ncbi:MULTISPECIES: signal peptidase II [Tessaracoccus]|uniref:signal peptidase II n=1 Tax=Tessaracoccus TaxID=72763 RepID=UPI0021504A0B|nr:MULTISPECIES: signal peptidase II [Tessaracoccus]
MLGLGVDQLVKLASVAYLQPGRTVELVGQLLQLTLIRNPGAAFGMGSGATIVFSAFAVIATVACLAVALPRITQVWHAVALGLLLAGITGNLVDRITQPPSPFRGHVIDMFQLQYFGAIFNVADVCITAAAAMIIVGGFVADRRAATAEKEPVAEDAP